MFEISGVGPVNKEFRWGLGRLGYIKKKGEVNRRWLEFRLGIIGFDCRMCELEMPQRINFCGDFRLIKTRAGSKINRMMLTIG